MSGQASRGVWQPLKTASFERQICSSNAVNNGVNGGRTAPEVSRYAARGAGRGFRLAPEAVAAAAVAGDDLSDSESDDGEGYAPRLTVDNARNVFDPEPEHEDDSSTKGDQDGAVGSAEGGARGSPFARDKALAALEDAIRVERDANAERLADRMGTIAAEVGCIELSQLNFVGLVSTGKGEAGVTGHLHAKRILFLMFYAMAEVPHLQPRTACRRDLIYRTSQNLDRFEISSTPLFSKLLTTVFARKNHKEDDGVLGEFFCSVRRAKLSRSTRHRE